MDTVEPFLDPEQKKTMDRKTFEDLYRRYVEIFNSLENVWTKHIVLKKMAGYEAYETFRKVMSKDIRVFHEALADQEAAEFDLQELLDDSRSITFTVDEGYFTVHETCDVKRDFDKLCRELGEGDELLTRFVACLIDKQKQDLSLFYEKYVELAGGGNGYSLFSHRGEQSGWRAGTRRGSGI